MFTLMNFKISASRSIRPLNSQNDAHSEFGESIPMSEERVVGIYLEAAHHSMCLQSFISLQPVSSSVVLKPYGPEQTSSGVKCVTLRLYVATVGLQIFRTFIFPVHQDTPCISVGTQVEHNLQIF